MSEGEKSRERSSDLHVALWNTLHDGWIEGVSGVVPGTLRLTVQIPYLARTLDPDSKCLIVELLHCTRFEYRPFNTDTPVDDLRAVWVAQPVVLSAARQGAEVHVVGEEGVLAMSYLEARVWLSNGRAVEFEQLLGASSRYWNEWERRHGPA